MTYDGPLIDAHHHLWDLSMNRHPWIAPTGGLAALGDLAYLRKDYLPADFAVDSAGQNVIASVFVEAHWDRARDALEEIEWLDSIAKPDGIAAAYVAFADLVSDNAERTIERLTAHARVKGVRETIRWHPDPKMSWAPKELPDDPRWRRGVAALARKGLLLELLVYPWQAEAVHDVARAFPDLTIVVNHCSSPMDRDEAGIERWRRGLRTLADTPNVHLKLSNFPKYAEDASFEAARAVVMRCIGAFSPARCLWASDYPVARRAIDYPTYVRWTRDAVASLSIDEQRAVLCGNAAKLYGIDIATV